MNITFIFLANIFISLSMMAFYENILLRREIRLLKESKSFVGQAVTLQNDLEEYDSDELSSYEKERLEREFTFDKRIEMMKEELAKKQSDVERVGNVADIGDPLISNLPHDIINHIQEEETLEISI